MLYYFQVSTGCMVSWHGIQFFPPGNQKQQVIAELPASTEKNVGDICDNLENVMVHYEFELRSIYNCNETGLTTAHKPSNVIAETGVKQVGQVTSTKRGTLITMNCALKTQGHAIPPFLIS